MHVVAAGIPQRVVDHGVHQLVVAAHAVAVTALHQGKGSQIHVLHAAGDHDVSVARLDHLGRHVDAVQTGAAHHVDGDGGGLDGQASLQSSLTGHVLALTGLNDTAHVDVIHLLGADTGAGDGLLDDNGAQISGGDILEGAAELADGGTAGGRDNDFLHG